MRVNPSLPRHLRVYVACVVLAGAGALAHSLHALIAAPPSFAWLYLAVLTLFSGYFTVKVPSIPARISVSETFVFTAILLFGTAPGTLIVALDGFIISIVRRKRRLHRVLFNTAEPVFSIWLACLLFTGLGGTSGTATTRVASQVVPLFALAVSYFLLNSWLTAFAVSFETRTPALLVWRQHFLFLALNYVGGASVALLLWRNSAGLDLSSVDLEVVLPAISVILPLLVISYLTFKGALGRVQDATDHITQLNSLYLSTLETLAMAIDAKDQITHGHIRRVQTCAIRLARELGIRDDALIQAIEAAALLHDIGKIGVPEHILNKPGKLTPAEFERMKLHASIGADLVSTIHFRELVVPIVRHHHENWDGTGYPDGLSGTTIPVGARILSVVDCYDALTSDRPYRKRLTDEEAVGILTARRGVMYDPVVVDAFLRIERYSCDDAPDAGTEKPAVAKLSQLAKTPIPDSDRPSIRQEETVDTSEELLELCDVAGSLSGKVGLADATACLWSHLRRVVPATTCAFFLLEPETDEIVAMHVYGEGEEEIRGCRMLAGERVSGWVAVNRRTIVNADAALDLSGCAVPRGLSLLSCLSTPMAIDDGLVGVLSLYSMKPVAFSEDHRRVIQVACPHITRAIKKAADLDTIRGQALRDSVTGLPTMGRLKQFSDSVDVFGEPTSEPVAIVLVDVVGLSTINRRYGRRQGDVVLGHVAAILRNTLRAADILFRSDSDEFAVLLAQTDFGTASNIAARMADAVRSELLILDDGNEFQVDVATGVAVQPQDGTSWREALVSARNRVSSCCQGTDGLTAIH
jgi:diguanylate cyclase (GGDEF)-like protein/putative nucleotidyltransferase with HDIG domain